MKQISIVKIDITNPVLNHYKKAIDSWDKEQEFIINDGFFGIFLEDKFIGAAKVIFNEETSTNKILITNNKNYDYSFKEESMKQLLDIILEEHETKNINLSYVKKLCNYQEKTTK